MEKHWTERLFIEKPALFQASLEWAQERASDEVAYLQDIFSKFGVSETGTILDLGCGIGRHAVLLAEKGFQITGVDLSSDYITHAKQLAIEQGVDSNVNFKVGDMRNIGTLLTKYKQTFDVVLNLFTSMGYYDEDTDRDMLSQLFELTASNGILVIEIVNRDFLIRHFQAKNIDHPNNQLVLLQERTLNLEDSRMENVWTYYEKQGQDLKFIAAFNVDHTVYSLHELKQLVEASGWTYQTSYGSFDLKPLTTDTSRIVLVAKKM